MSQKVTTRLNDNSIRAEGKRKFKQFYNIPDGTNPKTRRSYLNEAIDAYEGFDVSSESEELCRKFNINVDYYYVDPQPDDVDINKVQFNLIDSVVIDPEYPTVNILLTQSPSGKLHADRITDVETLTGYRVCPYCKEEVYSIRDDPERKHQSRFLKHCEKCKENNGRLIQDVQLNKTQQPYAPHITKQKIYQWLLAHNLQEHFRPTRYYITFDFETLETNEELQLSECATLNAYLKPFMVSSTVKTDTALCASGLRPSVSGLKETVPARTRTFTKNFCLASSESFISDWIEWLFDVAPEIVKANVKQYDIHNEQFHDLLNEEFNTVNVIGFNSGKFDLNLILRELNTAKWKIKSILGSSSQFKQITVKKNECPYSLRFIDIRNYIAGGTLDQFTQDFGNNKSRVKSFFPYQFITWENWETELFKTEPFTQESFYSALTKETISDSDYQIYLSDYANFKNRLDYFIHYCNKDVEIMIDPIDKIIDETFVYKIDMLHNLSLSSNASMIRYALAYKDFDPNEKYPEKDTESNFELTKKYWKYKVDSYKKQDEKAKRDTKNNVSMNDYQYYHDLILTSKCSMCGKAFTYDNKPTLDRIDNDKPHTKENCQLMCCYCNVVKSNKDEDIQRLRINLRNYALKNNLPMTLDSVEAYHILRNGITGGLSNVQHRVNLKGITHINKLSYDPLTKTVSNKDTDNIMTHFVGVDFNSLYPSSFSSNKHEFIKYTDGRMYMPGRLNEVLICDTATKKAKALGIIRRKDTLFVAEVKGHIDEKYINDYINFLPIIRNLEITTDEQTIGEFMYNYMKTNNLPIDQKQRKLTQLASTHNTYMPFSSYYLWYLIDRFHFIIDDIQSILTFTKNTCFNTFANEFMNERQKAELEGNKGKGLFCKISLNGSYGYDAMNTQNYAKTKIMNEQKARVACMSNKFKNIREIGEDTYQVMMKDRFYRCDTCLQEAFFTLDNAKYWYLVFIYDFMYKCMDVNKFHFIEGDTDSSYWAIAGDPSLPNTQAFQAIIKNKTFYDRYIYQFAPFDFFCFNDKFKPKLNNKAEEKAHEKKLLGLAIEKQGDNMIALCSKCYTSFNGEIGTDSFKRLALKMKGVSMKQNKQLTSDKYLNVVKNGVTYDGENIGLQLKNGQMTRLSINKTALTGSHTKAVVHENGCCMPFIVDAKYVSI